MHYDLYQRKTKQNKKIKGIPKGCANRQPSTGLKRIGKAETNKPKTNSKQV